MKMGKCVNLRRLADKIYRSRPVRNGMIIATIVLMTCLIMSMAGVMEAADYLTRQENMRNFGTTAQGIYTGLTREQYEALKQMAGITEVAGETYLGVAAENMGNTQVYVYYASEECAAENFHGLTTGKWPASETEAVVDGIYAEEHGAEIGQTITVSAPLTGSREYTVTGICAANKKKGNATVYLYVSGKELPENVPETQLSLTAYCGFSKEASPEGILRAITASGENNAAAFTENPVYGSTENSLEDMVKKTVLFLGGYVLVFLTVTSLYRIFMFRDVQFFGQLKSVGVTEKQCRKILMLQSARHALWGIITGLLLGVGFDFLFLPGLLRKYYGGLEGYHGVPPQSMAVAAVLVLAAMFFGLRKPLRMLHKISPIQAVGYAGDSGKKISRKSKKVSLSHLAGCYIKQEKGRSFLVMGSVFLAGMFLVLTVSLTFFLTGKLIDRRSLPSAFLIGEEWYCKHVSETQDGDLYDYPPHVDKDNAWAIDRNTYYELWDALPDAEVTPVFYNYGYNFSEDVTGRVQQALQADTIADVDYGGKSLYQKILNNWEKPTHTPYWDEMRYYITYENLAKCKVLEGELDYEKWMSGNYVVMGVNPLMKDNGTLYHAGDRETLYLYENQASMRKDDTGFTRIEMGTPKEYEVLAVVDGLPDVCAYRLATLVTLLPAENIPAEDNSFYLCALMVDAGDLKGTEEKIREYVSERDDGLYYVSNRVIKEEAKAQVGVIRLLGGSFALILLGVALMNILNYILLSRTEREKDYRTLHQVGMTGKQLRKMRLLEYARLLIPAILLGAAAAAGIFLPVSRWINSIL